MGLFGRILSSIADAIGSEDTWYCDGCHSVLNEQDGFNTYSGRWTCTECGYDNDVSEDNLYSSEEEYQEAMGIPRCLHVEVWYRGTLRMQHIGLTALHVARDFILIAVSWLARLIEVDVPLVEPVFHVVHH